MQRTSQELRERRHLRIRKKVQGTSERPRLAVYRSLKYIYCQVIDDQKGVTLLSCSSNAAALEKKGGKKAAAEAVGLALAEAAKKKGIQQVVFDRGGYRYHGRVQALADAARKGGLSF